MKPGPQPAVLIEMDGEQRWCTRCLQTYRSAEPPYTYSYRDVVTGASYPPHRCKEIREGTVKVDAVEITA